MVSIGRFPSPVATGVPAAKQPPKAWMSRASSASDSFGGSSSGVEPRPTNCGDLEIWSVLTISPCLAMTVSSRRRRFLNARINPSATMPTTMRYSTNDAPRVSRSEGRQRFSFLRPSFIGCLLLGNLYRRRRRTVGAPRFHERHRRVSVFFAYRDERLVTVVAQVGDRAFVFSVGDGREPILAHPIVVEPPERRGVLGARVNSQSIRHPFGGGGQCAPCLGRPRQHL